MAPPKIDNAILQAAVEAVRAHGGVAQAARALGIAQGTLSSRYRLACQRGLDRGGIVDSPAPSSVAAKKDTTAPPAEPDSGRTLVDSVSMSGDTCEVSRQTPVHVRTLEDLIRVCEIDTDTWEIERWVANKWEMGYKDIKEEAHTIPLYQVKAWLRRKSITTLTLELLQRQLVADIRKELKAAPPQRSTAKFVKSDWLFEFSPFDLHMGKFAWGDETVTNYDVEIAADLFDASLEFLLNQAMKLSDGKLARVLCVFGNDVAHIDSKRGETTHGTRMDVDTRYIKVYRRICAVHRRAVDILRGVAPVDIVVVPGNHDELTSFHLGEILATRYEDVPHVTVDNGPRLRKYYEFGTNLFGFTHGDKERVQELGLTMAREMPDAWARCESREWHIGHKHIKEKWTSPESPRAAAGRLDQDIVSDKGVRIRRLSSMSAHDAWHTGHGYMDRRACDAFLFHRAAGFTSHVSFNIDHKAGRALSK